MPTRPRSRTTPPPPPAVVLLSGGLDSATALAIARRDGFACHALTFDYGQRHRVELKAARAVARQIGVASHRLMRIDLRVFGGSALTADIAVPKNRLARRGRRRAPSDIPVTYVPARNTIFLSCALALAEVLGAADLYIGVNALDYSGYPDCRPAYIRAFARMANLATRAAVQGRRLAVHAPLLRWRKTRIIGEGIALGVDYGLTHSCYDPIPDRRRPLGVRPCRRCDACLLREKAFVENGIVDPVLR